MTAPSDHLDVLDPRFPIRLSMPPSIFHELIALRPDRACADGELHRARVQAARREERYVTPAPQPRFVPERAHEDTSVDGIPAVPGDAFDRGFARWDRALHEEAEEEETAVQAIILDARHTGPRAGRRQAGRRLRRLGGGRA
jgi:hypothetical protein